MGEFTLLDSQEWLATEEAGLRRSDESGSRAAALHIKDGYLESERTR